MKPYIKTTSDRGDSPNHNRTETARRNAIYAPEIERLSFESLNAPTRLERIAARQKLFGLMAAQEARESVDETGTWA